MSIRGKLSILLTYYYWPALADINTLGKNNNFLSGTSTYQEGEKSAGQVSTQRPRPRLSYQDQVKRHKE